MNNDVVVWGVLATALICANLPFISNRLFFFRPVQNGTKKPIIIRLLEWLGLYFIIGLIALGLENKVNGQIHAQDWEFYAITFFMFLVLAVPGFIYRYTFQK